MKKKIKKLLKNKRFIIFLVISVIFLIILIFLIKLLFPESGSNYGNRLDGIEKYPFSEKAQKSVTSFIKENEKVESSEIKIHGKIINIIFDVKKDATLDEAKALATLSLQKISKKVKGFYDIEFIITKKKEEGEKVEITKEDGKTTTEIKKQFPIMGYKNSNRDDIVW